MSMQNLLYNKNGTITTRPSVMGLQRVHRTRARRQTILHILSNASYSLAKCSTTSVIIFTALSQTLCAYQGTFLREHLSNGPEKFSVSPAKFLSEILIRTVIVKLIKITNKEFKMTT